MEIKSEETFLNHRTRPVDLFSHEVYDLFELDCACVPNRSFGGHHESRVKGLEFVPSGKLTTAQSSLRVGWGVGELITLDRD